MLKLNKKFISKCNTWEKIEKCFVIWDAEYMCECGCVCRITAFGTECGNGKPCSNQV